jgi:hypothetical protein
VERAAVKRRSKEEVQQAESATTQAVYHKKWSRTDVQHGQKWSSCRFEVAAGAIAKNALVTEKRRRRSIAKPGAELYQVQVTEYAEVYQVKSYIIKRSAE